MRAGMVWLVGLIFFVIAAVAAGFVVWPILRSKLAGRAVLAASALLFVLGLSGGFYLYLGKPHLAVRTLQGPRVDDFASLLSTLAVEARARPNDLKAWSLLWPGYLRLKDPRDAEIAFRHAVALAPPELRADMYAAYGEELSAEANGITDQSETAFKMALALDPTNREARYYMGFDYAAHGENQKAIEIWQGLLAELPANSRAHGILVDRIAELKATSGGAPDIGAMVAGLAARLKANPDDPGGWQRLIRAYSVLGDMAKAKSALSDARIALRADPSAETALDGEAKELKLEK
jgi:cytochrome c-type biogenesis protein CcmH